MRPTILLTTIMQLLLVQFLFAQEENALDSKYSPPSGSVFDEVSVNASMGNGVKNTITFDLGLMARGQVVFGYTRSLGSTGLAFSLAAGLPYGRDFLHAAYYNDWAPSAGFRPYNLNGFYEITSYNAVKPLLQGSLKYYLDRSGYLDDSYLEVTVRSQHETFTPTNYEYPKNVIGDSEISVKHRTILIGYGRTYVGDGKTPFVSHFTYGIGIRTINAPRFDKTEVFNLNGTLTDQFTQSSTEARFSNFVIYFKYALGLGW